MMRFVYVPHMDQIPQWADCYYDYKTLNKILVLLGKISQKYMLVCSLLKQELNIQLDNHQYDNSQRAPIDISNEMLTKISNMQQRQLNQLKSVFYQMLCKWFFQFNKYSYRCHIMVSIFVKMKQIQINQKFTEYKKFLHLVRNQKSRILLLLENLYIQGQYLSRAISFNQAQQIKITSQFEIFTQQYPEHYKKFSENIKLKRLKQRNDNIMRQIELSYMVASSQRSQSAYQKLQAICINQQRGTSYKQLLAIGIAMGVIAMIIVLIVLTDLVNGIELQTSTIFMQHFPVWRGASYILFFLWIIGIDVLFYQRSQINYRLIFQFKTHNMPQSKYLFLRAGILSLIYIIFFYLFTGQLSKVMYLNFINFGALFWAVLFMQLIITTPINMTKYKRKKFNFLKILGRVIASPCIKVNFLIIWVTEQLASFNQPFGDLFYTICFVSSNNPQYCITSAPYASSGYILTIFLYRMIQNLKLWHQNTMNKPDKKYDFKAPQFIGFFRGLLAFITALFALLDRLKVFNGAFIVWLVLSIITTLYSWYIDIKYDWGIFDRKSKTFLREKLLFPSAKFLYYFFAIFNLVLRTAWILNISTLIFINPGFQKLIFTMIISYLQIFRRGVWNILRIQNEHIKNCAEFRATITDDKLFQQVRLQVKNKEAELEKKARECQQLNGQSNPITRLKRKITKQFLMYQNQNQDQAQLRKVRTQETKKLFRQEIKLKNEKKQWLRVQIRQDNKRLLSYRLKLKKRTFIKQILHPKIK